MLCVRDTEGGIEGGAFPSPFILPTTPPPGTLSFPLLCMVGEGATLGGEDPPAVLELVVSSSSVGDPLVLGTLDNRGVPRPPPPEERAGGGWTGIPGLLVLEERCWWCWMDVVTGWREEGGG